MPQKINQRIVNSFKGVDYSSNDIDREFEYLKDSNNVCLSYSAGIRGRKGARPLITGIGNFAALKYEAQDVYGKLDEQIVLCNGDLFKLSDFTFTITTATSLSYELDQTSLITRTTQGVNDTLSFPSMVLSVNGVKYPVSNISIGELWEQLIANGHTLSYPTSSRTVSWGKLAKFNYINNLSNSVTFLDIGTLQINDIVTVRCDYATTPSRPRQPESRLLQGVVVNISGLTVTIRFSDHHVKYTSTNASSSGSWVGPPAVTGCAITSVNSSGKSVTFKYPEPIPSVVLFKQVSAQASTSKLVSDHGFLGVKTTAKNIFYDSVNANESLFITHGDVPSTNYDFDYLEPPYLDVKSTAYPQYAVVPLSGGGYDSIANNTFIDWGLGKYDSRRAYYAGAAPIQFSADYTSTAGVGPGGLANTTDYYYVLINYYVDARGRVVYGNPYFWDQKTASSANPWYGDFIITLTGEYFSVLGYGMGATAMSTAAGTGTTLTVKVPHGILPGDTLYYVAVKNTGAAVDKSTIIRTDLHETRSVQVSAVRGNTITLTSSITYGINQRFVANQRILIARTRAGGVPPNYYVVADLPMPESVYWNGYLPSTSLDYTINFHDRTLDTEIKERFDPSELGYDATRTRSGSSLAFSNGRLIVAQSSNLVWSNPEAGRQSVEQTPPLNSINVGGRASGAITSLRSSGGSLYAFKRDSVNYISGDFDTGAVESGALIEGDYGANCPQSVISFGGMLLCNGNGETYVIKDGIIYDEIGAAIRESLRGITSTWDVQFSLVKNEKQIALLATKPSINTVNDKTVKFFVLDIKKTETQKENQQDLVLTRSLFGGAWFPYSWKLGAPTGTYIQSNDITYYSSFPTVITALAPASTLLGISAQRNKYDVVSGLWQVWSDGDTNQFTDAGLSIQNMVNFTPIHKGSFDVDKIWSNLKFFRFLNNSDINRVTDWSATIELIYGLSNNLLTSPANVLKLLSSVTFDSAADTQAIAPLTGNRSPALEIRIVLDQLYKSMQFSTIILDYLEPFDVEGVQYTAEN